MPITFSKGDFGYNVSIPITDSAGAPVNLTGKTVVLKYQDATSLGAVTSRTLTAATPTNGIATWAIIAGDTATVARYLANIVLTSSGYQETVPQGGFTFEIKSVVA